MKKLLLATIASLLVLGCSTPTKSIGDVATDLSSLPEVNEVVVFTAETDPNDLLGRPGGYVFKANWHDNRIDDLYPDKVDPEEGGAIESYDTQSGAKARLEYMEELNNLNLPFVGKYYLRQYGNTVVRVSGKLTPEQAESYFTFFDESLQ